MESFTVKGVISGVGDDLVVSINIKDGASQKQVALAFRKVIARRWPNARLLFIHANAQRGIAGGEVGAAACLGLGAMKALVGVSITSGIVVTAGDAALLGDLLAGVKHLETLWVAMPSQSKDRVSSACTRPRVPVARQQLDVGTRLRIDVLCIAAMAPDVDEEGYNACLNATRAFTARKPRNIGEFFVAQRPPSHEHVAVLHFLECIPDEVAGALFPADPDDERPVEYVL